MTPSVVYDTMVFLQGSAVVGRVHATFAAVADGRVKLCVSRALLIEVEGILSRRDVRLQFPALSSLAVSVFLADVRANARFFDPVPHVFTLPGHPDDDHLFDLAIHAKARYLVTWETRLLALASSTTPPADQLRRLAPDLSIVTPAQFAAILRGPPVP